MKNIRELRLLISLGIAHAKQFGLRSLIVVALGYLRSRLNKQVGSTRQKPAYSDADYANLFDSKNHFGVSNVGTKDSKNRVSVLTDSVGKDSLFGGVATSLILGYLLAVNRGSSFRVITRTSFPDLSAVKSLLTYEGVYVPSIPIFAEQLQLTTDAVLEVDQTELIVSTSWWTTAAAVASNLSSQLMYLLQEDERLFYPSGEGYLFAEQTMRLPIRKVINTELLKNHLESQGILSSSTAETVQYFEPALGPKLGISASQPNHKKFGGNSQKILTFYARPRHHRNMFNLGIEAIEKAVAGGILDKNWTVRLLGSNIPKIEEIGGLSVQISQNLSWKDYQLAIEETTIGLALQASPHPGYPVLDFAVRSVPAITNAFGHKKSLNQYSDLIEVAEADSSEIATAIARIVMSLNDKKSGNLPCLLPKTWAESFRDVLSSIE